eukprot:360426-Chlamydomonas_euryale.AAC.6
MAFNTCICSCWQWARREPNSSCSGTSPPFPPLAEAAEKTRIIWSIWNPHEDYTECGVIRPPAFWCNVTVGCPAGWDLPPLSRPRQSRARGHHGRPRARVEPTGEHYSCSKPPLLAVRGDGEMERIHPPRFPSAARALGCNLCDVSTPVGC